MGNLIVINLSSQVGDHRDFCSDFPDDH